MEIICRNKKQLLEKENGFILEDYGNYLSSRYDLKMKGYEAIYLHVMRKLNLTLGVVKGFSFTDLYDILVSEMDRELKSGRWHISDETNEKRSSLVVKCRKGKK